MDLDTLLQKHGLPTWGSEALKKERAQRNNLLPWDKPVVEVPVLLDPPAFVPNVPVEPKKLGRPPKGK